MWICVVIFTVLCFMLGFYYIQIFFGGLREMRKISKYQGKTLATIVAYKHKVVWHRTTKSNIYRPIYEYVVSEQKYKKMYPNSTTSWREKKCRSVKLWRYHMI